MGRIMWGVIIMSVKRLLKVLFPHNFTCMHELVKSNLFVQHFLQYTLFQSSFTSNHDFNVYSIIFTPDSFGAFVSEPGMFSPLV